jgi:putative two-component system response regulator
MARSTTRLPPTLSQERETSRSLPSPTLPVDPTSFRGAGYKDRFSPEYAKEFDVDGTEAILFALAHAIEQRDHQTAGHCERLAFTSVALGMAMDLSRNELLALYRGGYLHDVGKVGIPDAILFKPGKLTAEEWVTMRSHTVRGEEICRHLASLKPVLPIIRNHHERWDGGGYPDGLRGEQIPLLARVVQIADIYDALVSPRPYKRPFAPEEAVRIIRQETANGWRDPDIVDLFLRLHKNVIARIESCTAGTMCDMDAMRETLDNLRIALANAS